MKDGLILAKRVVNEMYSKEYKRYTDIWSSDRTDFELLEKIENKIVALNDVLIALEAELRKMS